MPLNFSSGGIADCHHLFYGEDLKVGMPHASGQWMNLGQVAQFLGKRLNRLFLPDEKGNRPCHGGEPRYAGDPAWKDLALFYEYFHGDNGKGLGASHQTGWTALVAKLLESYPKNPG